MSRAILLAACATCAAWVACGPLAGGPRAAAAAAPPGWPVGARVERVRVEGAAVLGEEARRLVAIAPGAEPDTAAIVRGAGRLLEALENEGWLAARVDSVRATVPAGKIATEPARVDLVLYVTPGPRYRFGRVTVSGLGSIAAAAAQGMLDVPAGEPFQSRRLERGIERLLDAHGQRARPFASVDVVGLERRGDRVDVELRVVEGDSVVVREVVFDGLRTTRRSLLEKSMGNLVGLPYNRARLAAARQRLADLGVFQRVDEPVLEALGDGAGRAVFGVEEARGNTLDGAIGYQGDRRRLTGLVDVALGNLAGTGRQVALRWEGRGEGLAEFRFRYAEPLLFGRPVRAEVDFEQFLEDTLYTRSRAGGRFLFSGWPGARVWLGGSMERTVLEEGPTERATSGTTEVGFEIERRDDPLAPRRGTRAAIATATVFKHEFFRPEGDRRVRQLRARYEAEWHRPLGRSTGARLESEGALKVASDPVLPLYDLDPVGGALQLRGYREAEFRASRWAVARLEYGVFLRAGGRAFAFLDQGLLYRRLESAAEGSSRTTYRAGYGVGIELPAVLGTLGLSLGYGQGDGPLDGKVHVRLRSQF